MTKYVREKAGIQGVYGQNPIEWLHFMSKTEINDFVRNSGVTHREVPLSAALDALKGRNIRLYSDATKAIYGEGPYCLSPEFSKFRKPYDEWKDLQREERNEHLKKFLSARPQVDTTSHRVPTAHTNPTTRSENKEMLEEVPGQPQPRNLATASGHYRQLSIRRKRRQYQMNA